MKTQKVNEHAGKARNTQKRNDGRNDYYRGRRVRYVTFNDTKRNEYLTGFHKRKVERRRRYKENTERQAKEERKKIKKEISDERKKRVEFLRKKNGIELPKPASSFIELGGKLVSVEPIDLK